MARTNTAAAHQQFTLDILNAAVEGGVNYWASITAYKWVEGPATAYATVVDAEEEDGVEITVTPAMLGKALRVLARAEAAAQPSLDRVLGLNRHDVREILRIAREKGTGDVLDAGASDVVFQIAAFGEVVYG